MLMFPFMSKASCRSTLLGVAVLPFVPKSLATQSVNVDPAICPHDIYIVTGNVLPESTDSKLSFDQLHALDCDSVPSEDMIVTKTFASLVRSSSVLESWFWQYLHVRPSSLNVLVNPVVPP